MVLPLQTFAAGETWTWQADGSLTVTGGQLHDPATFPSTSRQTTFNINDNTTPGGVCSLSVIILTAKDNKSATLFSVTGQKTTYPACSAAVVNKFQSQITVQIGGTPPGTPGGVPVGLGCPTGQNPFDVTYYDGNAATIGNGGAPPSLTFTIGNQKETAQGTVENDGFGVNVSYTATFCLKPSPPNYQVCAPPLLACQTFTMPNKPFDKVYGNKNGNGVVFVGVDLDPSSSPGPYDITITGNGVNKTQPTTKEADQGTKCSLQLGTTFIGIKPGSYQVCAKIPGFNQCQTLNQVANTHGVILFDIATIQHNGQSPCLNSPTDGPPPPSPPCKTWANGVCTMFNSPFAGFSTNPEGFIQKIFAILLSVSGGIALLLIIKAGYQLMTAQGNPEKLNNAREQLVAAIVGLVFLIFSFVFLQLIGFDILHVPGFGGAPGGGASPQSCNGAGLQYCASIKQCYPTSSTCP